jgi:uncharacterized protein YndB with AHSA1/START domain
VVTPQEAWLTFEWEVHHPLSMVWEYLTTPRLEQKYAGYDLVERTDSLGGRFQTESTYHCAHGEVHFFNKILDWKPFDYVSIEQNISVGLKLVQTRRVRETLGGTKLIFHLRQPPDVPITDQLTKFVTEAYNQAVTGLITQLDLDLNKEPTV